MAYKASIVVWLRFSALQRLMGIAGLISRFSYVHHPTSVILTVTDDFLSLIMKIAHINIAHV